MTARKTPAGRLGVLRDEQVRLQEGECECVCVRLDAHFRLVCLLPVPCVNCLLLSSPRPHTVLTVNAYGFMFLEQADARHRNASNMLCDTCNTNTDGAWKAQVPEEAGTAETAADVIEAVPSVKALIDGDEKFSIFMPNDNVSGLALCLSLLLSCFCVCLNSWVRVWPSSEHFLHSAMCLMHVPVRISNETHYTHSFTQHRHSLHWLRSLRLMWLP